LELFGGLEDKFTIVLYETFTCIIEIVPVGILELDFDLAMEEVENLLGDMAHCQ
jgi:hypothetical protein